MPWASPVVCADLQARSASCASRSRRRRAGYWGAVVVLLLVPTFSRSGETAGNSVVAPDTPFTALVKGAVARPGPINAALIQGLPMQRRLVKIAGPDGQYRCTTEVEGYALKDILDRVQVEKVEDGFDRPLDTFISVKGRGGSQALLSYGEVYFGADGGPLLVERSRLLLPHHHSLLNAGENDPTVFRSVAERGRIDLQSCATCHSGSHPPTLTMLKGWLLVVPQDDFGGRFVEDVAEIGVRQVGIQIIATREAAKAALVEAPLLVGPDSKQTLLTPERYQQLSPRSWSDATYGLGSGFHGRDTFQGVDLGALLRPLLPAGADPRKAWVLVTAVDGYRSLFSGSEVFAPEGKGVLLVNRINGEILGAGSGRYHVVSTNDFYIDRGVRQVKEIRVTLVP